MEVTLHKDAVAKGISSDIFRGLVPIVSQEKCFIIGIKAQDATIYIESIRRTAALALSNADLPNKLT